MPLCARSDARVDKRHPDTYHPFDGAFAFVGVGKDAKSRKPEIKIYNIVEVREVFCLPNFFSVDKNKRLDVNSKYRDVRMDLAPNGRKQGGAGQAPPCFFLMSLLFTV